MRGREFCSSAFADIAMLIFFFLRALKVWIANDIRIIDVHAAANGGCTVTEPTDIENEAGQDCRQLSAVRANLVRLCSPPCRKMR
jgi:hypothetical protein